MSSAPMTPSLLSNAVIDADRAAEQIKAAVNAEVSKMQQAADELRNAPSPEHREDARKRIDAALGTISDHLEQLAALTRGLTGLAKQMPHGSTAAATGAVGTTAGGKGVEGVAGSAEDTLPEPIDEAAGTGIVGLNHDEINPDDKRSSQHKDEKK